MLPDIIFEFEGKSYTVSSKAYDLNRIVLPDNRVLRADKWLESLPPQPVGLSDINSVFSDKTLKLTCDEVAMLVKGVIATEKLQF